MNQQMLPVGPLGQPMVSFVAIIMPRLECLRMGVCSRSAQNVLTANRAVCVFSVPMNATPFTENSKYLLAFGLFYHLLHITYSALCDNFPFSTKNYFESPTTTMAVHTIWYLVWVSRCNACFA